MPEPVLKRAQEELLSLPGVGSSVMEISHRSSTFVDILARAKADLIALYGIPDNYEFMDPDLIDLLEKKCAGILG